MQIQRTTAWAWRHRVTLFTLSSVAVMMGLVVACGGVQRTVMAPPHIAGASLVGAGRCADCHEDIAAGFTTALHSWVQGDGPNAVEAGCESCHGPGSLHAESGGAPHTIINPRRSPETCFQCHQDKQGEFRLPHRHPVLEGQVACRDCHEPHSGPAVRGGDLARASQNDTCFQCHSAQRGPFVFEHEALREGCTTCHSPHGSVNPKMLVARNNNLCLRCHAQQQMEPGVIRIGDRDHASSISRGSCWSAGCHEGVHGSRVNQRLRY